MAHTYPQPGQPTMRQDGLIAINYLRGFRTRLANVLIQTNYSEIIHVGSMIHEAKKGRYWEQWPDQDPPFRKYGEWTWGVLHYRERKADALQKIYLDFAAMHLSEPTLYRALKLGWTKLNVILRAARSEVCLIRWLDRVEEHNLTQDELSMEVSGLLPEGHRTEAGVVSTDDDIPPQRPKARSRPAKRQRTDEGNDDDDDESRAENIYPPSTRPSKSIRKTLVFEDQDSASLVFQAIKTMQDASQGELGAASAITIICSAWMAKVNADTAGTLGGQVIELEKVLRGLEVSYKVPILIGNDTGLLARVQEMLTAWGCAQHDDERVRKLLKDINKVLRR